MIDENPNDSRGREPARSCLGLGSSLAPAAAGPDGGRDGHLLSESALRNDERATVAAVRADLTLDEARERAAVGEIRRDFRARTETLMILHAAEKKALGAELL